MHAQAISCCQAVNHLIGRQAISQHALRVCIHRCLSHLDSCLTYPHACACADIQEVAEDMLQKARDLAGDTALSSRQAVKITLGLAHLMTMQVVHMIFAGSLHLDIIRAGWVRPAQSSTNTRVCESVEAYFHGSNCVFYDTESALCRGRGCRMLASLRMHQLF